MVTKVQKYIKMASFLAVLCAVILFPPASAHAGMVHGEATSHQTEHSSGNHGSADHSMDVENTHHDDLNETSGSYNHDGGSQCCSGMCVSTVPYDFHGFQEKIASENHVALPVFELASTNLLGFLRPPNP
ncbi:MAG: hypothetical protein QNK92_10710 [Amylibacter sp.]